MTSAVLISMTLDRHKRRVNVLMHPTVNTIVHQVLFHTHCTVCAIIERPKSTRNTMPAARDGMYP